MSFDDSIGTQRLSYCPFANPLFGDPLLPIYVDVDDVIASTIEALIQIAEREFGKVITYEQITDFDLKKSFDLTGAEYDHLFDIVHRPEEILKMNVIEGALEGLNYWVKKGYSIAIVTGRLTSTYESSIEWLDKQNVPYESFTIVDKYSRPGMDKNIAITLDQLSERSYHFAIEDSAAMAQHLSNHMNTQVALLDRPWNRSIDESPKVTRCMDWEDLSRKLDPGAAN